MKQPNIAFANLRAEMSRDSIYINDFAQCWGVNRDTASRKLSRRSPVNLDEAFKAQQLFFPNQDLRYLFSELISGE